MNVQLKVSYMHRGDGPRFPAGTILSMDTGDAMNLIAEGLAVPVQTIPHPADPWKKQWEAMRRALGVQPFDPHLHWESKRRLSALVPGDTILLIRKYGGLGDILIVSCLVREILRRFPKNPLTLATPKAYHCLFRDVSGLALMDWERVCQSHRGVRGGIILSDVARQFTVTEDVSTPCHVWETLYKYFGGFGGPLLPQNRLDMWGDWIGVTGIERPATCITITDDEVAHARRRHGIKADARLALVAPVSALDAKDFPYWRPVAEKLAESGFAVRLLGEPTKLPGQTVIKAQDPREFLALVKGADLVVAVDSAALHAAGIMGVRCLGLFNINDGATYTRYYPTVRPLDLCVQGAPCIMARVHFCQYKHEGRMTCYPADSADRIVNELRRMKVLPGRAKKRLRYTVNPATPQRALRLNLGCGTKMVDEVEWMNVDVRPLHPDTALFLRHDVRDLAGKIVRDGGAAEIRAHDVLEHLSKPEAEAFIRDCRRMLAPGGILEIKTPCIRLLRRWLETHDEMETALRWYGGNDYPENCHRFVWPEAHLLHLLRESGFRVLSVNEAEDTNLLIRAEA